MHTRFPHAQSVRKVFVIDSRRVEFVVYFTVLNDGSN